MNKERALRKLMVTFCTLAVTVAAGKVLIDLAYLERGYEAVGGEHFLIPVVCWIAWKRINSLVDKLRTVEKERT